MRCSNYAVRRGEVKPNQHQTADGYGLMKRLLPTPPPTSFPPLRPALARRRRCSGVLSGGASRTTAASLLNRPNGSTWSRTSAATGGDVLVEPNDGCNIVQEYVVLSMSVTQRAHIRTSTQTIRTCIPSTEQHPRHSDLARVLTVLCFIAPSVGQQGRRSCRRVAALVGIIACGVHTQALRIRSRDVWKNAVLVRRMPCLPDYTALA